MEGVRRKRLTRSSRSPAVTAINSVHGAAALEYLAVIKRDLAGYCIILWEIVSVF